MRAGEGGAVGVDDLLPAPNVPDGEPEGGATEGDPPVVRVARVVEQGQAGVGGASDSPSGRGASRI